MPDIVGVLLAGGQSRRFGADKLLHPLADGVPMALSSARKLIQACPRSICIVRPEQQALGALLKDEGFEITYSPIIADGMGHSLAQAIQASPDAAGWVVALADMPYIASDTIHAVVQALGSGASLVAPFFQGRRGHPLGFSATWFEPLSRLQGDKGARDLIKNAEIQAIHTKDSGILLDIDTPAMLEHFSNRP